MAAVSSETTLLLRWLTDRKRLSIAEVSRRFFLQRSIKILNKSSAVLNGSESSETTLFAFVG
jgi:phage FluMu gp28-like protein